MTAPSSALSPTNAAGARGGGAAHADFKEASSIWTNECAVSTAVTTTDSGIFSNYASNNGQGSENAGTSHRSVWLQSEGQVNTTDSEVEDGGAHSKSGSQQEGSQDRKRALMSQSMHYSPFKKRKKVRAGFCISHSITSTGEWEIDVGFILIVFSIYS